MGDGGRVWLTKVLQPLQRCPGQADMKVKKKADMLM